MTSFYTSTGRSLFALVAAFLIGTGFVAAATGPALVTPAVNSDIVA